MTVVICKPKYKKELLYPIFIQICNTDIKDESNINDVDIIKDNNGNDNNDDIISDNGFWNTLFLEMAYGIFPFGIFIEHNVLYCNFKDKKFNYDLNTQDDHSKIYNDLRAIFKKIGICSKLELLKQKIKFQSILEVSSRDWNLIKKRKIKDILIENYVIRLKYEKNYSIIQTIKLYKKIILGLFFKTINNHDITYDENIGIVNILIRPITISDITIERLDKITCNDKTKKIMSNGWSKFKMI